MEPFLSEPVSQLDPSVSPTQPPQGAPPTQHTGHSSASQSYMRYLFLTATIVRLSVCLSISVILSQIATYSAVKRQLLGRARRKRASERAGQSRAEQSAGLRTGGARPLFDPRLAAHAFLCRKPSTSPKSHRTVPHRITRHRTVPHFTLPSGPSPGRPVCFCCCAPHAAGVSSEVSSMPQRLT